MRPSLGSALLFVALASWAGHAHANSAKPTIDGDDASALVPVDDAQIRVDSETLTFRIGAPLERAEVTARYTMTNVSEAPQDVPVAFAYLSERASTAVVVTVDGAPVEVTHHTDRETLEPEMKRWAAAHPEVAQEAARLEDRRAPPIEFGHFAALAKAAGARCEYQYCSDVYDYLRYARERGNSSDRLPVPEDYVTRAAREMVPASYDKMWSRWATPGYRSAGRWRNRLGWFLFSTRFEPKTSHEVIVKYTQIGEVTIKTGACTFDYLLTPARHWKSFGALDVVVTLPPDTQLISNFSFASKGSEHTFHATTLPTRELEFTAAPHKLRRTILFPLFAMGTGIALALALIAYAIRRVGSNRPDKSA